MVVITVALAVIVGSMIVLVLATFNVRDTTTLG